ncbi:MAG: ClC family H(+)/Cl(-) exchange transporter, partial [Spirochaetia bacterium]
KAGTFLHILVWIAFLIPLGIFLGWMNKRWPMINGSGIPQVRGAIILKMNLSWWLELPMKLLSAVIAIGLGLSLGREGPSIQIGAYVGNAVHSVFRRPAVERKILLTSGAAAGLAAAFNAPLAGVLFVVEELHKHFTVRMVACAMGASLAGYTVVSAIFGLAPIFSFEMIEPLSVSYIPAVILLGAAAAVVGHLFKLAMYRAQDLYPAAKIPAILRPVIPLLITIPIGLFTVDLIGSGHHLIQILGEMEASIALLIGMLAIKILFSALSYGSGVAGGIFLPLLACGAILGKIWGVSMESLGYIDASMHLNFIIFGMAAFFTSVVKTPITGSVLILEMSGNFSHFSELVAGCLTAYVVSELLRSRAVYDVFLERMLRSNPAVYRPVHGDKVIVEVPVSLTSGLLHRSVNDVPWPEGTLIVGIERGETELIPDGKTEIEPGDRLLVMVTDETVDEVRGSLLAMGGVDA